MLPKSCEFYLFRSGIKPLWEDPANKGGGRYVLHIKKIFANKTWEDMLISLICSTNNESDVNGVVINVRSWEILLSVWMKKLDDEDKLEKYRAWIRNSLGMTENIKIEFKEHPKPEDVKNKPYPPQHDDKQEDKSESDQQSIRPKQESGEWIKTDIKHEKKAARQVFSQSNRPTQNSFGGQISKGKNIK